MKIKLQPIYFEPGVDADFDVQLGHLERLLSERVEFLQPLPLGSACPDADGVIFPQMLGEAYRKLEEFKKITVPILVVTSEFGTLSMWDWEICSYLRSEGVRTIAPYHLSQTNFVIEAMQVKNDLRNLEFLVYQDNPGDGFQASIFKRFYWWEDECMHRIKEKFGLEIRKKSFRELGQKARLIPAEQVMAASLSDLPREGITTQAYLSALRVYLAVKGDVEAKPAIGAIGINCLNESHFSDSTPCLAWNLLFEESKMLWGCEADTLSMLTKYLVYHTLKAPVMMTNLYPFLMGQSALKHEKIPEFPAIAEPENHLLIAHCGYMGVIPQSFSTEWTLKPKVLSIVDENATAIDARLPIGPVTLVKLSPTLERISVIRGELVDYVQYPDSHCLNGGVIRVADGRTLIRNLESHHYILVTGDISEEIDWISPIFSFTVDHY
jgi:hypothetical protein